MNPEGGISYNTLRDPGEDYLLREQELQELYDLIESQSFESWDDELQPMQSVEETQPCELCHEIDEQEKISDGFAEDAQAPQAVTIEDYDRVSSVAHYGYQHVPFEPGHEEAWIPDHPIIPGLDSEWDVAMLCPDAQEWFTNHTLDVGKITSCGHLNHFRLGNHLRAVHAKKTWVEEVAGGIFNKHE